MQRENASGVGQKHEKKCNFSILQSDLFAFLHFSFHFISKNILKLLKGISFYAFIRGEIEKDIKRFRTIYHLIFLFDIFWVQKYERTTSGVGGGGKLYWN